jgi:transcriptional regulator with XRE-family HTH domain
MIMHIMEYNGDPYFRSDTEIIQRIGEKIKTVRLNRNITREELQKMTGVHKKTIGDAESGKSVTMTTLIAILRGLRMLDQLDRLLEDEPVSPVMIAKYQGKIPQRASGKKGYHA